LGSKQALSNGNELEELTDLLAAFQQQNECQIVITVFVRERKGRPEIRMLASARAVVPGIQERNDLDSASVGVWCHDYKLLMGAFSSLLYALDFQLAEAEWGKVKETKA